MKTAGKEESGLVGLTKPALSLTHKNKGKEKAGNLCWNLNVTQTSSPSAALKQSDEDINVVQSGELIIERAKVLYPIKKLHACGVESWSWRATVQRAFS